MTMAEGDGGAPSPFVIGIDLGTTNCALAYIDMRGSDPSPQVLQVPQWESESTVISAPTLPAFYYLPPKGEWKKGQLALPQATGSEPPDFVVGRLARAKSSQVPGRVIHAAKSWLCHPRVDRQSRILPWHVGELVGDERRSPVEVSAAYLSHLKTAWEQQVGRPQQAAFSDQDVVITVPASFDEVAQRLTLEAAGLAGFPLQRTRLLEEPQAAFYYWLRQAAASGTTPMAGEAKQVLICDIGGGTSDFSLFRAEPAGANALYARVTRTQVSDHLLLGGDNIDLSLAHLLEPRLVRNGQKLSSRQWAQLVFAIRQLKEQVLSGGEPPTVDGADQTPADELHVSIAGEGASLFATAMTASLTQSEMVEHIVSGFLPAVSADERPHSQRSGLQQLSLPYAQDSALTRHLAGFLAGRKVDAVLFTGGTLKPAFMRRALLRQLTTWQGDAPQVLEHDAMDLSVALGAAVYAAALRRPEQRIGGGYGRSLYVEVAANKGTLRGKAASLLLCVVPQGYDGVSPLKIDAITLKLRTGDPVRFQLWSANNRPGDRLGELVTLEPGGFHALPALDTRLDGGSTAQVDVYLEATLAETGILHLACVKQTGEQRWALDFNVRASAPAHESPQIDGVVSALTWDAERTKIATAMVVALYGKKRAEDPLATEGPQAKTLLRDLEAKLQTPRDEWPTDVLRSLWPALEPGLTRRNRSLAHEVTWLYLAGYALRPGFGFALDEWRLAELWRCFDLGLVFAKEKSAEEQWWLMWRRVAGGLSRSQQERMFDRIYPMLRKNAATSAEVYLLAGSLERIDMSQKIRLGQTLAQQITEGRQQFWSQRLWALARISSRVPLYGGPDAIVRPEVVAGWFQLLKSLKGDASSNPKIAQFLAQSGRMVVDREFDLSPALRDEWLQAMAKVGATPEQLRVVSSFVPVDAAARTQLFGESLPAGLVLS